MVGDRPHGRPCHSHASDHRADSLATAFGIGDDTDTVAAIAGGLLGAGWGASAVPAGWRRMSGGYPGLTGERLVELAHLAADRGAGAYGWPLASRIDYSACAAPRTRVLHPYDDGVWLPDASALDDLPDDVRAAVSLCLVGGEQTRPDVDHHVAYPAVLEPLPAVRPIPAFRAAVRRLER